VTVSPAITRQSEPDQACADAVDLARAAAEADAGPGQVGAHVGMEVEGDRVVTHLFACLNPAYVGWRWAVTVTRASRAKQVTVDESVLLPGPDSLLAPAWVPWTERVRPGDLKAGDLLPARADDERLVPVVALAGQAGLLDWEETDSWRLAVPEAGQRTAGEERTASEETTPPTDGTATDGTATDGTATDSAAAGNGAAEPAPDQASAGQPAADAGRQAAESAAPEAGPEGSSKPDIGGGTRARGRRRPAAGRSREESVRLLRPSRVLSAQGRDEAAVRWYTSEQGPRSPLTAAAPANCMTCGFMVRVSGPLGRVFGVCANEFAPDDGRVVSVDHGCGAHSEGETPPEVIPDAVTPAVDELGYDMLHTGATVPESVLESIDQELR
jgi:Protein of unknown function (DUF3027)